VKRKKRRINVLTILISNIYIYICLDIDIQMMIDIVFRSSGRNKDVLGFDFHGDTL